MPTHNPVETDIEGLDQELAIVYEMLTEAGDTLEAPLKQLVRSQIEQAAPFVRAAVALSAGVSETDSDDLRHRRIQLAAALEMLFIAHNIHGLLLTKHAEEMDRSVMGSTILAGDYCFSHAAVLAVGTESPQVVAIFAQALKTVSEGNLRHLFGESDDYNENDELFIAGIEAATMLANLSKEDRQLILDFGKELSNPSQLTDEMIVSTLPEYQWGRWQNLRCQLVALTNNGSVV